MKFEKPDINITFIHNCEGEFKGRLIRMPHGKDHWTVSSKGYGSGVSEVKYCPGCGEKFPETYTFDETEIAMIGAALSKWGI